MEAVALSFIVFYNNRMDKPLKITKIGNSAGIVLPKEVLAHLDRKVGDELTLVLRPNGIELVGGEPDFEEQMAAARKVMAALEVRGKLDDTVVIFASDHGDSLGDHNLVGKGTFFESSTHVPLALRGPSVAPGQVKDDLVGLTDVTATLLSFAGCELPGCTSGDSIPLPGTPAEAGNGREIICGALDSAWMAFDGRWKLAKYDGGEQMLFDLDEDPGERVNLLNSRELDDVYRKLDGALTKWVMSSIERSHADKVVYLEDLSADAAFAKSGWQRPYPHNRGEG